MVKTRHSGDLDDSLDDFMSLEPRRTRGRQIFQPQVNVSQEISVSFIKFHNISSAEIATENKKIGIHVRTFICAYIPSIY